MFHLKSARLSKGNVMFVLRKRDESRSETPVWSLSGHSQGGWEQLTGSEPVSTMFKWCELIFVDIQQPFSLATIFRQLLILWFTMAQHGTAFLKLEVVLFSFSFFFFSPRQSSKHRYKSRHDCRFQVYESKEYMVTHSTVVSPAFRFHEVTSV